MFGVLLESRARRQRRPGSVALSVATHLAIVAAITMTTVRIAPARPNHARPTTVYFAPPKTVQPPVAHVVVDRSPSAPVLSIPILRSIEVPREIPTSLHPIDPIDFTTRTVPNDLVIGSGSGSGSASGGLNRYGLLDGEHRDSTDWRGTELLMRIVTTGKPRYPERLRAAGIEGTVLVRFVVDTTGRVNVSSAQIISSTHALFSRAVLDALAGFRFRPAEVGTRRVAALAEMPFEFRISK
jgi:protein TonB